MHRFSTEKTVLRPCYIGYMTEQKKTEEKQRTLEKLSISEVKVMLFDTIRTIELAQQNKQILLKRLSELENGKNTDTA